MHCLSCGVRCIVGTGDPCRRHWEGEADPEEPRPDIIPPFRREDSAMIRYGARHIADGSIRPTPGWRPHHPPGRHLWDDDAVPANAPRTAAGEPF